MKSCSLRDEARSVPFPSEAILCLRRLLHISVSLLFPSTPKRVLQSSLFSWGHSVNTSYKCPIHGWERLSHQEINQAITIRLRYPGGCVMPEWDSNIKISKTVFLPSNNDEGILKKGQKQSKLKALLTLSREKRLLNLLINTLQPNNSYLFITWYIANLTASPSPRNKERNEEKKEKKKTESDFFLTC